MSSDALPDVLAALNTGILDGDFALSLNALGPYIITSIEGLYFMTNGVTSTPTPTSKPTGIPTSAIVENEGIKLTTVQVRWIYETYCTASYNGVDKRNFLELFR